MTRIKKEKHFFRLCDKNGSAFVPKSVISHWGCGPHLLRGFLAHASLPPFLPDPGMWQTDRRTQHRNWPRNTVCSSSLHTGWVKKSNLLILSEYSNKTEKIGRMRTKMWTATDKMKYRLIFSPKIFYITIVLWLNILWLKAVNEITARQTVASLRNQDVIKVCSIQYLTTHICDPQ